MFLRLQTQWNMMQGAVIGLNYQAALEMMKLYDIKDPRTMLEDLRVMEASALIILNKKQD